MQEKGENRVYYIKHGSGKKATPVLGIQKQPNEMAYEIWHVPSSRMIGEGYLYISLARKVGAEIYDQLKEALLKLQPIFPPSLIRYLRFYQIRNLKEPLSFEEWLVSPDAEERISPVEANLYNIIQHPDVSLGWIEGDEIDGRELRQILTYRSVSYEPQS